MEFLSIDSAAGAKLLPFARQQARRMRAAGMQYATRNFEAMGLRVRVQIAEGVTWIRIAGGATVGYEFFVTEDLREYRAGLGSAGWVGRLIEGERMNFTVGHGVGYGARGKAVPLFSHVYDPDALQVDGWIKRPVDAGHSTTDDVGIQRRPGEFTTLYSWQNQKLVCAYCWYRADGLRMMTSALGANVGLGQNAASGSTRSTVGRGDVGYSGPRAGRSGETAAVSGMDEGFDIKGASYNAKGIGLGARRADSKVYHRRCAEQEVALPGGGTRVYVIQTDSHGGFSVWPEDHYQSMARFPDLYDDGGGFWDVMGYAQRVRPPYPGWVYTPDEDQDATHEQMLWQWNSDGTRCATVAVRREEAWVWTWFHGASTNEDVPGSYMKYANTCPAMAYATMLGGGSNDVDTVTAAPLRTADGSRNPIGVIEALTYVRLREWRHKTPGSRGLRQPSVAYEFQPGRLFGARQEGAAGDTYINLGGAGIIWEAVDAPNVSLYEPAFTYLPGLLELGVRIVPGSSADTDPLDFTVEFEVLRDEPYTPEAKRYVVDAAYYIPTPRNGAKALDAQDGLVRDDLLTADVECYYTPGPAITETSEGFMTNPGHALGGGYFAHYLNPQFAQGGPYLRAPVATSFSHYPARSFHDHIDEPLLESRITGQFRAVGVYAYYTVRKGEQRIQRICLAHNMRYEHGSLDLMNEEFQEGWSQRIAYVTNGLDVYGFVRETFMPVALVNGADSPQPTDPFTYALGRRINYARGTYISTHLMPASFVTTIAFADLRYLNFMTLTYQREKAKPSAGLGAPASYRRLWDVKANRHLRIRGEAARSVLYTEDVQELGEDPAWNRTEPPEGAVLLPSIPRGGSPCGNEGVALAMQQDVAAWSLFTDVFYAVAAHPKGHWAACWNCTQHEFSGAEPDLDTLVPPLPTSTHPEGWIDVIHIEGGKSGTHRDAFNTAFKAAFESPNRPAGPEYEPRGYGYYADKKRTAAELAELGGDLTNWGSFMSQGIFYDFTTKGSTP